METAELCDIPPVSPLSDSAPSKEEEGLETFSSWCALHTKHKQAPYK